MSGTWKARIVIVAASAAMAGASLGATEVNAGSRHGVNTYAFPPASDLQRMATGGARSARAFFFWNLLEPTPGSYQWAAIDQGVIDATRAGIQLLPVVNGSPPWVAPAVNTPPIDEPADRAAYTEFVRQLAARYGTSGSFWAAHPELPKRPIVNWQIWNEVNLGFHWGGPPNAREYADLLRLARTGLKAGDPAAKIVLAGLIPFKSVGGGSVPGDRYLQRLYKVRGVRKLFEIVALHPYGRTAQVSLRAVKSTRRVLNSLGARKVPIWLTEFGWATGGTDLQSSPLRATLAQQANRIAQTYKGLKVRQLGVKRAFYFSYQDTNLPSATTWSARMGLFDVNGQPKPAWFAYTRSAGGQP